MRKGVATKLKTNKSFTKRLKVTRKGKVLARSAGHNHFNAKASRNRQLERKKSMQIGSITAKVAARNMPGLSSRI